MRSSTPRRFVRPAILALSIASLGAAVAPHVSKQQADVFARKIDTIAASGQRSGSQRTPVTESELNSWFLYRAQTLMPNGLTEPSVSMIGNGKVSGTAVVDLDRVAKKKATGGTLDPWSYLGGRVPVTVVGTLETRDGVGRFEIESAQVSSVPVPKMLLQQLLSSYSRTPEHPNGFSLDDPFALPANIQRIEVGVGQAVVVQ